MTIVYGAFTKHGYCSSYGKFEMEQMSAPYDYHEMVCTIAKETGFPVCDIFIENVNGEDLRQPIGFYK